MNSYIAIALVLCVAVAQVHSQGAQPTTGGASAGRGAAGSGGLFGNGGMLPLMAANSGNDMMQNLFLFRMLSQNNRRAGGAMGGLEPLLMSNLLGMELFGM